MGYGTLENVPLDKIIGESNRKYTSEEGFEQLVNSIVAYGIIEPPMLRRQKDGQFKIIAGRRRIAAARAANDPSISKTAFCTVVELDDPASDEELALAENVNRLNMHPLDEAASFSRMADRGASIAEIAKYFARSPQAIYQRLRLASLIEELKGMFRDGRMGISEAAVLAELPEEDQKDFFEQYGMWTITHKTIDRSLVMAFVQKKQRFKITEDMKVLCAECAKRTHNEGNDLFEEYEDFGDVCLDGDCYRRGWRAIIEKALAGAADTATDNKIYFSGGIPQLLYKKATHVEFSLPDAETKFEVLREKDYEFSGPTTRKKDACWNIWTDYDGKLMIQRVGYKLEPPKEEAKFKKGLDKKSDPASKFEKETMNALSESLNIPVAELAAKLQKKTDRFEFNNDVVEAVYYEVIERRIAAEKDGVEPPHEYFSMFMEIIEDDVCVNEGGFADKFLNERQKKWLKKLTGSDSLRKVVESFPDEIQKIFHFLFISYGFINEAPGLNALKDGNLKNNIFMKYAGMSADEYREMYLKKAAETAAKLLEEKPKKGGKKKAAAVRKCRVCGCTDKTPCVDEGGDSCSWVEDDLCSACADDGEA